MGYGGYGVSIPAFFNPLLVAWLERGGVYAVAHVRGGGEKGRRWYEDGRRDKKMNGVRDFLACADYLVAKHYTSPAKLAAQGVSMGGVLIGRAIDERPELFAAAIIEAGVLDPVRIAAWPNGPGQEDDLGSPDTATGMAGLLAMDPYQNVRPHAPYPGVLLVVGLNDQRVPPWMSGKFAARVAAATTSGRPVWLRVDGEAGHGGIAGSEAQIEAVTADELSFVLEQAGDPQFQPAAAR
ncbi:MAG: prolyl oligopeptidase family serine peptidase [Acidobacteriota bacterium]